MNFLTIDDILNIHTFLAGEFGGTTALRDQKALEEVVTDLASGGARMSLKRPPCCCRP